MGLEFGKSEIGMSYILPQQLLNWPDKFLALCVWQDALWRLGFRHVFEVQSRQFCSKLVVSNAQKTAYFLVCIIPSIYTGIIIKLSTGGPLDMRILGLGKTRINGKSHGENKKVVIL